MAWLSRWLDMGRKACPLIVAESPKSGWSMLARRAIKVLI
jgi:hypothetical protein